MTIANRLCLIESNRSYATTWVSMNKTATTIAQSLLRQGGPHRAWQTAINEAIDAHLRRNTALVAHWVAVQQALRANGSLPGASEREIIQCARVLIAEGGVQHALEEAMHRAVSCKDNLPGEVYNLRVADTVIAMSPGRGRRGLR